MEVHYKKKKRTTNDEFDLDLTIKINNFDEFVLLATTIDIAIESCEEKISKYQHNQEAINFYTERKQRLEKIHYDLTKSNWVPD